MKIRPKRKQVMGRVATFAKSQGGIELVSNRGITTFVIIDAVGSDVTEYKVGDITVPHKFNHIFLPDGRESRAILHEDEILATIDDVPLEQLDVQGSNRRAEESAS